MPELREYRRNERARQRPMSLAVVGSTALRRPAARFVATQLVAKAFGLGFLLLAARVTQEAEFGRFVLGALAAAVLALVFEFGRASHCMRLLSVDPTEGAWAQVVYHLRLTWLPALPLVALTGVVEGESRYVAQVLALGLLLAGNTVAEAALLAVGRAGLAASANVAYNGAAVAVVLAVGARGTDSATTATALLFAQLVGAILAGLHHAIALGFGRLAQHLNRSHIAREPGRLSRAGVSHLLLFLSSRSDQLVLGLLGVPADLGLYGVAARVNDAATSLPSLMTTAAQPGFVKALAAADRVQALHRRLAQLLSLSAALGLVIGFAVPLPLDLALPERYDAALGLLPILGVGMVGYGFQMFGLLLVRCASTAALHHVHTWGAYSINVLLTWSAAYVGYRAGGLTGLAFASASVGTLTYAWVAWRLMRQAELPMPRWAGGVIALTLIAAALASGNSALHPLAACMLLGVVVGSRLLPTPGNELGSGLTHRPSLSIRAHGREVVEPESELAHGADETL